MLLLYIALFLLTQTTCSSLDTIVVSQNITDGDTIVSGNEVFELGFFSPGASMKRYLGIWFKDTSPHRVIWVANRETPLLNTMSMVKLDQQGILSVINGGTIIWSSNSSVSRTEDNPLAQLLDTGNLVIQSGNNVLWQSFDYPGDTLISGMKLGKDLVTGREMYLTSWRSADDPSPGEYTVTYTMVKGKYEQLYIRKNSVIQSRIGPYNGVEFAGQPNYKPNPIYVYKIDMVINDKEMYYKYTCNSTTFSVTHTVTPAGKGEVWHLNMRDKVWMQDLTLPMDNCDNYGLCGPYGSCSTIANPNCGCLKGFLLKNPEDLTPDNWTSGCRRNVALDCGPGEGFHKFSSMKLPDTMNAVYNSNLSLQECEVACKSNCSCNAYANPNTNPDGVGCLLWFGDLTDTRVYPQNGQDLYVRLAASELLASPALRCQVNNGGCWNSTREGRNYSACIDGHTNGCTCPPGFRGDGVSSCEDIEECKEKMACQCSQCKCKNTWGSYECSSTGKKKRVVVALSISAGLTMLGLISALYIWSKRKWRSDTVREGRTVKVLHKDHNSSSKNGSIELLVFSLSRISKATDNFSIANQLGEGGFGPVYKGVLEGLEIAVKRLSKSSRQGIDEFENEVKCIAKLQHRNLVKLLGYCIQCDETMLVYEYMHNKSLDCFIFDDLRKSLLDWPQRFHIINGIARGLLYLHQDSRLRVVHRDLKAGNILLDHDMNPKISDFVARMFKGHESEANTKRVVGTLGYISPEYAVNGLFSVKSIFLALGFWCWKL